MLRRADPFEQTGCRERTGSASWAERRVKKGLLRFDIALGMRRADLLRDRGFARHGTCVPDSGRSKRHSQEGATGQLGRHDRCALIVFEQGCRPAKATAKPG